MVIDVRMYDASSSGPDPEQSFYFGRDPYMAEEHEYMGKNRLLTSDVEEMEAVSFTMGADGNAWSLVTVYGLMKSGDVYALCPILPRKR
jgi:nucleoporin NUP82